MRKLFLALVLAGLAACATSQNETVARIQNLTTACNSIEATVNTLTALKVEGRLSQDQIAFVNTAKAPAVALCDPVNPPVDTVSALTRVNAVLAQLTAVAANPAR